MGHNISTTDGTNRFTVSVLRPNILRNSSSQSSGNPSMLLPYLPYRERNKSAVLLTWHLTLLLCVALSPAGSPNTCLGTSKERKQPPKRAVSSGIHFLLSSTAHALLTPEAAQSLALCVTFPQAATCSAPNPGLDAGFQINEAFLEF